MTGGKAIDRVFYRMFLPQCRHLMFATKKITSSGHWIGVCEIASKKSNLNFNETIYAYTATSIALADGFISCWEHLRAEIFMPLKK